MFLERRELHLSAAGIKKLLLCDKHIVFGGFSVLLSSLTGQLTPSLLRCCFFVNCYLSDSHIIQHLLEFAFEVDFFLVELN